MNFCLIVDSIYSHFQKPGSLKLTHWSVKFALMVNFFTMFLGVIEEEVELVLFTATCYMLPT